MKKLILILVLLIIVFIVSCTRSETNFAENNNDIKKDENSIEKQTEKITMVKNQLISSFYKDGIDKNKNFVFSPYSLIDCFKILYPASEGKSREEIETILGLDKKRADKLTKMDKEMIFEDGIGMKVVNKAYINNNVIPIENIHTDVLNVNDVDVRKFEDNTYEQINEYVSENTNEKINNLLNQNSIDKNSTISVLLNCLYFMNTWQHEENTIDWTDKKTYDSFSDDCSLTDVKEDGDIDILRLQYTNAKRTKKDGKEGKPSNVLYYDDDNNQLDYSSINPKMNKYSMYIICDNVNSKEENVDNYIKNLSDTELLDKLNFDKYKGLKGYTDCYFNIPCFELRHKNDNITELLTKLGMTHAVDPNTNDFKKFAPVFIDKVMQECYIKTDKGGTEAAAATAMVLMVGATMQVEKRIKTVIADNTFAFFLVDDTMKEILFAGRISDLNEQ